MVRLFRALVGLEFLKPFWSEIMTSGFPKKSTVKTGNGGWFDPLNWEAEIEVEQNPETPEDLGLE